MEFMAATFHLVNGGPFIRNERLLVPDRIGQKHGN
jgi:hypothetical protein